MIGTINFGSAVAVLLSDVVQIVCKSRILVAILLAVAVLACVTVVVSLIARASDNSVRRRVARLATERFFSKADVLLSSPNVPTQIKIALYGLLRAVTVPDLGSEAFAAMVRRAKAVRHGHEPPPGQVALALRALRKENPELAGQCAEAARDALCALLCAHGHSDRRVSVEVQLQVNQQDELARLVERIAERIDGSGYGPIATAK